jgi:hypothetical protein
MMLVPSLVLMMMMWSLTLVTPAPAFLLHDHLFTLRLAVLLSSCHNGAGRHARDIDRKRLPP